jgi:hypothetical protein
VSYSYMALTSLVVAIYVTLLYTLQHISRGKKLSNLKEERELLDQDRIMYKQLYECAAEYLRDRGKGVRLVCFDLDGEPWLEVRERP